MNSTLNKTTYTIDEVLALIENAYDTGYEDGKHSGYQDGYFAGQDDALEEFDK